MSETVLTEERQRDDATLMTEIAAGHMEALGELVRRHQAKVLALAIRTLGREDVAEDAAQDVFVKVYRAAPAYRPEAKFTTWLYRVAVNHCLDMIRKDRRRHLPMERAAAVTVGSDAGDQLQRAEQATHVRQAVASLPERQRMAVVLHRFHGLNHREVAEATGWSLSAVESLLVRAYSSLRNALVDMKD